MSTLKRIFILLVMALVVVGATVTVANWGGTQSEAIAAGAGSRSDMVNFHPTGERPSANGFGDDSNRLSGRLFGLGDLVKNLVVVSAIVVAVVVLSVTVVRLGRMCDALAHGKSEMPT